MLHYFKYSPLIHGHFGGENWPFESPNLTACRLKRSGQSCWSRLRGWCWCWWHFRFLGPSGADDGWVWVKSYNISGVTSINVWFEQKGTRVVIYKSITNPVPLSCHENFGSWQCQVWLLFGERHGDKWNLGISWSCPRNQGTIPKFAKNMMGLETLDSQVKMHPATRHGSIESIPFWKRSAWFGPNLGPMLGHPLLWSSISPVVIHNTWFIMSSRSQDMILPKILGVKTIPRISSMKQQNWQNWHVPPSFRAIPRNFGRCLIKTFGPGVAPDVCWVALEWWRRVSSHLTGKFSTPCGWWLHQFVEWPPSLLPFFQLFQHLRITLGTERGFVPRSCGAYESWHLKLAETEMEIL